MGASLAAAFRRPPKSAGLSVTRRAMLGGGLTIAFGLSPLGRKVWAQGGEQPSLRAIEGQVEGGDTGDAFQGFAPGGFVRIAPDGRITLLIPNIEMGQGIHTAEAMLIAEELEVGLDQVEVLPAPPNEELYKQPLLQSQTTGGSTSIRATWTPLRQAGAMARTLLIGAAAARWNVNAADCVAARGVVTHSDCGHVVNPDIVTAQVEGGLLFGLSAALYNGITIDAGRVQQTSFDEYGQLRMNESIPVEVYIVPSTEDPGGMGETSTVSAAPALGNAIFASGS
jgi:CO/xanthine dehydrogenase Mo-binding subunit